MRKEYFIYSTKAYIGWIAPIVSLSGSVVTAFDDINVDDPDFQSIQVLAEAGMVPSKLSWKNSSNGYGSDCKEDINFFPDRFISRQDLMEWRTQVEYGFFSGIIDQISIEKAGYMDVKEITSAGVYLDMLAGDSSILRKVFGQSKRFQPSKPSTKAQAAVALTSGRMKEAISAEMSRLEAEISARQDVAKEIRSELLSRGDIQKFWDAKLSEEKNHGSDIERLYLEAVNNLVEEKFNQEKINVDFLKEQAAMDCQKQMMLSLKKEVDEISDKLASERVIYVDEKQTVQKLLRDLEFKHEEILDTKSTLEAEKEALQMLRSWVEDEARRSQARAAILSEHQRLQQLEHACVDFKSFINYVKDTWLTPYSHRLVEAWINQVLHLGNTTTNRVEFAHWKLKEMLENNLGGMCKCW
ncbi:unnamed protein product [Vicia faba]|uniref:SLH domain-containing protein n=1 Tax=Vicia faba TaxID=3906 RepID=A0AAV0ZAH2_VICFA|nr:unnamed protein product [Vicia faba]